MTQKPKQSALRAGPPDAALARRYSLVFALLLAVGMLHFALLPGLLGACLGFLAAKALVRIGQRWRYGPNGAFAAVVVIVLPLMALVLALLNAKSLALGAMGQYQALLQFLAQTVLEIRKKIPPDWALYLPEELMDVQLWLADMLKSKASVLAGAGTQALHGLLLVYVGLVVGALMAAGTVAPTSAPLRLQMRERGGMFIAAFGQVVVAQFWIAVFNASCTAALLLIALPLAGAHVPYIGPLVTLTFFCGLIPIVGNLLCNAMLSLAGLSVSVGVGIACLVFLVVIHKAEYAINARILGKHTNTASWELLAVMFIGEALFGLPGLVAAPLYYGYAKKEWQADGWI
jgi:predicted PurR-regulated permease PerM